MDSAREVVARAIWSAAPNDRIDDPVMFEHAPHWQQAEAFRQTDAALTALAQAGFAVVPRVLLEDTTRATDDLYRYHFTDRGSYDGKSERDAVLEAGRKIKALLAAAGAKEGK